MAHQNDAEAREDSFRMRDAGLEQAIKAAGGISALARGIGVAQPSVSNWVKIPAERVLAVESITAISRTVLRPDLYPSADNDAESLDPTDEARGRIYLLLSNLLLRVPSEKMLAEIAQIAPGEGVLGEALTALAEAAGRTNGAAAAREHFDLFVGVGRGELLPYASYYLTGFLYERPLVRIREDLKVLGLARDESVSEPEDGAGFLCEVMAGLALQRFASAETYQARFFARHLSSWAEKFFSDLEGANGADFYRAVGRLGRVFIGLEREAFALDHNPSQADASEINELEESDERQAS